MSALWTALHERSHEGLVEDYMKLMAEKYRLERKVDVLSAPIGESEWNGNYTGMGMRSRETVNEILARRGRG